MIEEEKAIAFVDLSGFTALTEVHGDETGTAVALRFYDMVRSCLVEGTLLVKTIGDAVMLVANDVDGAVSVVFDIQELADATPKFPVIRAGLHVGPACAIDNDYFGAAVNIAARVAAHASAGQILCTAAVANRVTEHSPYAAVKLGPVAFRNVHDRVLLFELRRRAAVAGAVHVDPVCRMHVSSDAAVGRLKSGATEYYFCSVECLRMFMNAQTPDDTEPVITKTIANSTKA